jgi:urease accessory protein
MKSHTVSALRVGVASAMLTSPALAHHAMDNALPANAFQGFVSGIAHPIIGLDHLLFVLAIGAACHFFGRRAETIAIFIVATLAGTAAHLYQATLPYADAWVALSLVLLGILLTKGVQFLRSRASLALFAIAGIVHGYAYGEAIVGAEATPLFAYLAGFAVVQLCIASAGFALTRYAERAKPALPMARAVSGVISLAGAALLVASFA